MQKNNVTFFSEFSAHSEVIEFLKQTRYSSKMNDRSPIEMFQFIRTPVSGFDFQATESGFNICEAGIDQQWIVCTSAHSHQDSMITDGDHSGGIYETAEQFARLRTGVAIADSVCQQSVQSTGHQRQL